MFKLVMPCSVHICYSVRLIFRVSCCLWTRLSVDWVEGYPIAPGSEWMTVEVGRAKKMAEGSNSMRYIAIAGRGG